MEPSKYKYVPAIRTRDAELKGLDNLRKGILRSSLPLLEFTQSRRSAKNPDGSVSISIEKAHEIMGEQPYIADLTSLKRLQNKELAALLKPDNNFVNWIEFVEEQLPKYCVPTLHLTLPFSVTSFKAQARRLAKRHEFLAVRIPTSYDEYVDALNALVELFGSLDRIIILLDAGFVQPRAAKAAVAKLSEMAAECDALNPVMCSTLASSFPSSVVSPGYGEDGHGVFELTEVTISESLKSIYSKKKIIHGDYASIHPLDFEGTVTNWVPRVDVPLDDKLYYYRCRRDDGGYVRAAKRAIKDEEYVDLDCWGCENIEDAAKGEPQGRNPAHWIAVRLNIHMSRQIKRLKS